MCARRFLAAILVITLLAVVAAFAIFQFGGSILLRNAIPKGHFQAEAAGDGPDYASAANWVAHPDMAAGDNPTEWLPTSQPLPAPAVRPASLFFIHPTTSLERGRWNVPTETDAQTMGRTRLFVQSQASAFNGVARIWAPRYRQATYGAFLLQSPDARAALDLAYGDVRRAFDHYLAAVPAGEPVILAGHSQGALHLLRLLGERKDKLKGRLVAAYVVGWPVDRVSDLPATGIPVCATATSTACVMSWQSFGEPANPSLVLDAWEKSLGPDGPHRRANIVCTNPLNGTPGGSAAPADNPGTLIPDATLSKATLSIGKVGASCEDGLLIANGDIPPLGPFVLPGNNYHVYDYALFWGAVRRDAERRVAAWRR